jgi:hypothetical protein
MKNPLWLIAGLVATVALLARPGTREATHIRLASVDTAQAPADTPPSPYPPTPTGEIVLPPPGRDQEPPLGDFVHLIDVSGSTNQGRATDPLRDVVPLLGPTIRALAGLDEVLPQRHRVGTIGSVSLRQKPRCTLAVPRRTLFVSLDTTAFPRALSACERLVSSSAIEPGTDIRGALLYAGLSLRGKRPALRGIVLFSDLEEHMAKGLEPAVPDLQGLCVAIVMQITEPAARDPSRIDSLQTAWSSHVRRWGARDVTTLTTMGYSDAELASFFRSCEDR